MRHPTDDDAIHAAAIDLMILGEIAERLGAAGSNDESDMAPATWLELIGRQVSAAAGKIEHHRTRVEKEALRAVEPLTTAIVATRPPAAHPQPWRATCH